MVETQKGQKQKTKKKQKKKKVIETPLADLNHFRLLMIREYLCHFFDHPGNGEVINRAGVFRGGHEGEKEIFQHPVVRSLQGRSQAFSLVFSEFADAGLPVPQDIEGKLGKRGKVVDNVGFQLVRVERTKSVEVFPAGRFGFPVSRSHIAWSLSSYLLLLPIFFVFLFFFRFNEGVQGKARKAKEQPQNTCSPFNFLLCSFFLHLPQFLLSTEK